MIKPESDLDRVWTKATSALRGVCSYCAESYGVRDALEAAGIPMLTDDRGHASLRVCWPKAEAGSSPSEVFPHTLKDCAMTTIAGRKFPWFRTSIKRSQISFYFPQKCLAGVWDTGSIDLGIVFLAYARAGVSTGD